jgi:hypothetical protein
MERTPNILDHIPRPSEVRERIAKHIEEGKILRRLLRVAEEAAMVQSSRDTEGPADAS